MHALIIGLWRNLGATLPEVDTKLTEREDALLAELAQVREARRLIAGVMDAAGIPRAVEQSDTVPHMAVAA